jgi:hypothetical protein
VAVFAPPAQLDPSLHRAGVPGGSSAAKLRDGARSLVPSGSRLVQEVEADCVELARSPSCVHIYYIADAEPLRERVRAVEQTAHDAGWSTIIREFAAGGREPSLPP